ncbi:uncharacterized protein [Salminus brasiliensis]|uniref:uncharacterized protein isoform X2 n=1 Tax=Salminus brasiliensis TaxID=930266 RepID=UPI003B83145C
MTPEMSLDGMRCVEAVCNTDLRNAPLLQPAFVCLYFRIPALIWPEMINMKKITTFLYTVVILWLAISVGSLSAHSRIFMTARVGSLAVLPCEWRDVPSQSPHIEWRTISETVFERKGEELYEGEGYEDRVDVPEDKLLEGNCSLVLKNVKPADAGVYESYLLVKRTKRSLKSKRVFIQSVELSVDESPEDLISLIEKSVAKGDAGRNCLHRWVIVYSLFSCLLFHVF